MDIDSFFKVGFTLFSITYTLFLILIVSVIISGYISSYIYESLYKKAIINILRSNKKKPDCDLITSIKTEYLSYRNSKISAFAYLSIDVINSKLISELRNDKFKKYYGKSNIKNIDISDSLERLNKKIQDELSFQEDDINLIINDIQSLSNVRTDINKINEIIEKIKIKFSSCIAFCNGRIFEKDIKIVDLERKLKRGRIGKALSWIGWIIGIVSGLITIFK